MGYTADVLVLGAGIVGAACAYRLAQQGLKVRVLEQAVAPAMGSTGKSGAGVRVQFTEATNILLSWHSIQEYRQMEGSGYRPIGYLLMVPHSQWKIHLEAVELQRSLGVPVEVRGLEAAQQWFDFNTEGIAGATFGPADGVIDPHGVCLEYLRRAKALGANLHLETEVLGGRPEASQWRLKTNQGEFEAPLVLNAAGAWAGLLGERVGLKVPVQPARRMVFTTAPLERSRQGEPLTIDLSSGIYFRPEGERLIFGKSNLDEVGFAEGMDWNWLEPTLNVALTRFPWFEQLSLDRRASWWGYYEITPDHNPILGRMPGVEGWVNACGFSGHGVQQAAMVGRLMAEEIVDGRAKSLNIDSLRYERFAAKNPEKERNIF